MLGRDHRRSSAILSAGQRAARDHLLVMIRATDDTRPCNTGPRFETTHARRGERPILPEKLQRALRPRYAARKTVEPQLPISPDFANAWTSTYGLLRGATAFTRNREPLVTHSFFRQAPA